jgi:hypothetical protein
MQTHIPIRRNVSFNLEPEVNFYKKRSQHVESTCHVLVDCDGLNRPETPLTTPLKSSNTFVFEDLQHTLPLKEVNQTLSPSMLPVSSSLQPPPPLKLSPMSSAADLEEWCYEGEKLTPSSKKEIETARTHEAVLREHALALAYDRFNRTLTPENDRTPPGIDITKRGYASPPDLSPRSTPRV